MKKPIFLCPEAEKPGGFRAWLFIHLGVPLLLGLSFFFFGPVRVNTMLLDMLPRSARSRAAAEADAVLGERNGREAVILAAASDFETAKNGASLLYSAFADSPDFETVSLYFDPPVMEEFREYLYKYRFVIAGEKTFRLLESGGAAEIAEDALASAFGAFTFVPLDNIETDPFLLTERRMEDFLSSPLFSRGNLFLKDDVLASSKDGVWYVLLRLTLAPGAVSVAGGNNAVGKIYAAAERGKETLPGLEFYFSGIPFHSYESSSGSRREISIISTVTLAVILCLFLYVFRSPLPVLFSILAAGFSLGLASASALLVFREIHIITFVFGTTLIGTCVDYSVHFFVHWKGNPALKSGPEIRSHILKSISMSFISTEICFSVFLLSPFPILRQFAVFSMTGLLSSFLTSLFVYPRLKMPEQEKRRLRFFDEKIFAQMKTVSVPPVFRRVFAGCLALCALAIVVFNFQAMKIKNDLTSLYTMSPFMLESEKRTAQVLDYGSPGWYFIVAGSSAEEVLENEERLARRLAEEVSRGNLVTFLAASSFVPSAESQKKTYDAMKALLPLAEAQFEYLGFPPEYARAFRDEFAASERYCLPEDVPSRAGISNLWIGEINGNYYSCVLPLHPSGGEDVFRNIAGEFDSVFFMNKAKDIGADLDTLTKTMLLFFLAAYAVVSVLVWFVYPRRDSLKVCAVPVFLVLAALAVLALKGIPPGFFSVAALVLVFGLGLDYIFYMVGKNQGENQQPRRKQRGMLFLKRYCIRGSIPFNRPKGRGIKPLNTNKSLGRLGVALSFLTTLLSFGALAFSSFAPVHIFGLTVSAGLGAAFISAMLLQGRED